jgi:hypothetical protein
MYAILHLSAIVAKVARNCFGVVNEMVNYIFQAVTNVWYSPVKSVHVEHQESNFLLMQTNLLSFFLNQAQVFL